MTNTRREELIHRARLWMIPNWSCASSWLQQPIDEYYRSARPSAKRMVATFAGADSLYQIVPGDPESQSCATPG